MNLSCAAAQTLVFELYGILGLLVQTVVLRVMLRAVGEVYVLLTGLCFEVVRLMLLGFAQAKYQARVLPQTPGVLLSTMAA